MAQQEWIFHRELGVGRVIDRLDRRAVKARFSSETTTVDLKYRSLDARSLRVVSHLNRNDLQTLVEEDPLEAAARMLLERDPMSLDAAVSFLTKLGCSSDGATTWRNIVEKADLTEKVAVDVKENFLISPKSAEPEPEDTDDHLRTLLTSEDQQATDDAERTLLSRLEAGTLTETQRSILAIVRPTDDIPVDPGSVIRADAKLLGVVATVSGDLSLLVEIVLLASGIKAARRAADRITELDQETAPIVASRLGALVAGLEAADARLDKAETAAGLAVERLPLITTRPDPTILAQVIRIAAHRRLKPDANRPERFHERVDAGLAALDPADGSLEVLLRNWSGGEASPVVAIGNTLPLAAAGFRLRLLARVADSPLADGLATTEPWRGIDLHQMADLERAEDVNFLMLTTSESARRALRRIVGREVATLDANGLADLLTAPRLAALAEDAPMRLSLERLADALPQARRIRQLWLDGPMAAEIDRTTDVLNAERASSRQEINLVKRELAEAHDQLDKQKQRLAHAQEMARGAVTSGAKASGAQLRQSWLDAAKLATDVLAELRRRDHADGSCHDALAAAETLISTKGIRRIGTPGETRDFDPTFFRMLSGESADKVIVVDPAYVTDRFDDVTIVSYGVVRGHGEHT
jgi:hypothetical protein